MNYKIGNVYNGFILKREENIKEVNSIARIFEHEKTGARLLHMENDDSNKVFAIGFKTPPSDSTGVMHILEHSVLCGSRKFPTKEPFVELVKGSLNTFLNAMTYSDKTIYPIASQNEKDFFNLMDVYLDAVFYPNIYNTKEILMQEGWHYDLEDKNNDLTYKGVVYNEMKGAFSSPEGILLRRIQQTLFPDNAYYNESGGDPKYIPDLTYDQFIETHKKFYHPSNSYIFLYGDGNLEKELAFINDNYLSNFDKVEIDSHIDLQKPYEEMKEVTYSYSISNEDDEAEKTFLSLNYVTGKSTDDEVYTDLNILEYILLEAEGAPLKKALIDAGIGKDVFGSFDNGIQQPVFSIIVKNSDVDKIEEFKNLVYSTLRDVVKNGIDKKLIEGCINTVEFKLREADTGSYPKGLVYYTNAMDSWLYGGDPLQHIKYEDALNSAKKALTTNHFEKLIEKYILNNNHASLLVLKPEKGLAEKEDLELQEKLKSYKESLSEEELDTIVEETQSLIKRQSTPDSPEALESIPMLSINDIDKEVEDLSITELKHNDVDILNYKTFTSDISYINFMFYAKCVKEEDISYFSLIGNLLGKLDTKKYNYKELSNEILINTGDLFFRNSVYSNDKDPAKFYPFLESQIKVMNDKSSKAIEILAEIIENTSFEDSKRIREIIRELVSRIEMSLMQAGHQVANSRLTSYFSPTASYIEKVSGYEYYVFLKNLEKDFDNQFDNLKSKLYSLKNDLFNKNNLTVSITGEDKEVNLLKENLNILTDVLGTENLESYNYKFTNLERNEGLMTPANVQYVAKGYSYKELGYTYKGSMLVLKTILGYDYLWNNVRVKGGAYGCMANINREGSVIFVSYRDPNLVNTLNAYNNASEYLQGFDVNEREMTKYIIGTISNLDTPLMPYYKGLKALGLYIRNITKDDRQRERNEILSTNVETIRSYSEIVAKAMEKDYLAVVGNEKEIKDNEGLFNNLINVFK